VELAFTGFCWAVQEQLHLHSAESPSHSYMCTRPSCSVTAASALSPVAVSHLLLHSADLPLTVACALDRVALSQLHLHSAQFLSHSWICTGPSCFLTVVGGVCVRTQPSFLLTVASALDQVAVLHFHMHSTQLFSHICFCTRPSCRLRIASALGRVAVSRPS